MMFYMLLYYCTIFCIDVFYSWEKKKKKEKQKEFQVPQYRWCPFTKLGDFVDRIYHIDLEIKDSTKGG